MFFLVFFIAIFAMILHQVIYYKTYWVLAIFAVVMSITFALIVFDNANGPLTIAWVFILMYLGSKPWQ